MIQVKSIVRQLAPLAMLLIAGCAPAYYDYSDCYIDCKYCVPSPLPYTQYEGRTCHACVASPYLSLSEQPAPAEAALETDDEAKQNN